MRTSVVVLLITALMLPVSPQTRSWCVLMGSQRLGARQATISKASPHANPEGSPNHEGDEGQASLSHSEMADVEELNKPNKTRMDDSDHDDFAFLADVEELNKPNKTRKDHETYATPEGDDFPDMDEDMTRLQAPSGMTVKSNDVDTKVGSYCSTRYNNRFWVEYTSYAYLRPPSKDGYYYDNRNCYYYFYSSSRRRIQAYCYYLRTVSPDFLQIYGGSGSSLVTLRGVKGRFVYTSKKNYLFMRFYSNSAVRWNGFYCRVRAY